MKKKIEKIEKIAEKIVHENIHRFTPITKLNADFGRADLNQIAEKINEIIARFND